MRRIIIGISGLVVVLAVALVVFAPHIQWDGCVTRQITVVVQGGDGSPIPSAVVTFRDREYEWVMKDTDAIAHMTEQEKERWLSQHYASGPVGTDGAFTFTIVFPAGGTRILFWDNGRFTLGGTISIQAKGHQPLERPLSDLAGQKSMSVREHRRKPIVIRCTLEETESHNQQIQSIAGKPGSG